jgi:hypothetical protein
MQPNSARFSLSFPNVMLRLEGVGVFVAAAAAYGYSGGNWLLFAALLLVPDVSMLGYLVNARIGAIGYNSGHTYVLPGLLLVASLSLSQPLLLHIALIWFAHIGMDRAVGYGFKYFAGFKETHLNRV